MKRNSRYENFFQTKNYTVIKEIRNLFRLKKETKAIKDRIFKDIKSLLEHQKEGENSYRPLRASNFWSNSLNTNTKVRAIEIKHYQLKNILIKLGRI